MTSVTLRPHLYSGANRVKAIIMDCTSPIFAGRLSPEAIALILETLESRGKMTAIYSHCLIVSQLSLSCECTLLYYGAVFNSA